MPDNEKERSMFTGFVIPSQNWFRLPNEWTDITAGMKSLAELKVVEYVLRHTWGYQEYGISKRISIDEFMRGRRRHDGTRMDHGTGLSKPSVVDGLRNAVEHGYLTEERNDRDKGRITKAYRLRMKILNADVKNLNRGVKNLHTRGKESSHRTEKETIERNLKTVNGSQTTQTPIRQLPDLEVAREEIEVIAGDIVASLGDEHSSRFYRLVATKVPADVIYQALSELKADGAEDPPKAFTYRMNRYALGRLHKAGD